MKCKNTRMDQWNGMHGPVLLSKTIVTEEAKQKSLQNVCLKTSSACLYKV